MSGNIDLTKLNGINNTTLIGLKRINEKLSTLKHVSEFYGVSKNRIEKILKRYRSEIEMYGARKYSRIEIRNIFKHDDRYIHNTGRNSDTLKLNNEDLVITNGGLILLEDSAVIKIGLMIEDDTIVKKHTNLYNVNARTKNETVFLNTLEDILNKMGLSLKRQYKVLNYRIDGYIPELNIAIEYDEDNHVSYTYEAQEGRQIEIENELGCKFIRIKEKWSLGDSVGVIMSNICKVEYKHII